MLAPLAIAACGAPQDGAARTPTCPPAQAVASPPVPSLMPVPPPPPSPTADLDAAERATLFQELVDRVHAIHVFSFHTKQNLGLDW